MALGVEAMTIQALRIVLAFLAMVTIMVTAYMSGGGAA